MAGKKIKAMAAAMAAGIFLTGTAPAYAYTGEEAEGMEPPVTEEKPKDGEATPFSVPGNGQLVDSVEDDGTKQFLTVRTKNGNTFFLVLDTSRSADNAYMLSLVDEGDLAGFLDEESVQEGTGTEAMPVPDVQMEEPQDAAGEEPEDAQPEAENSMNAGALFGIALLLAGGAGVYYYFKVLKPKKEDEDAPSENMEFYDEPLCVDGEKDIQTDSGDAKQG